MATGDHIEIANLICTFGDKFVLLDLFEEVVKPAFFDGTLKRKSKSTKYLFHEPKMIVLDEENNEMGIVGRFVKDTILEVNQVYRDGELQEEKTKIPSAPSSLFLLLLQSHRLLFLREHKGSPSLETFRSTLLRFLTQKHRAFLKEKQKEAQELTNEKPKLDELVKDFPYPSLELVPIASDASMQQFIQRFEKLELVTVRLLDTNSELDNDLLMQELRASKDALKSRVTVLRHENKTDGLDKTEATKQLAAVSKQGNHDVKVSGHDKGGEKLTGTNDNFKVQVPIKNIPQTILGVGRKLFEVFTNLVESKVIDKPPPSKETIAKARAIQQRHGN